MKHLKLLTASFLLLGFAAHINAQSETSVRKLCPGYPQDEMCCQKNNGTWVRGDSTNFCYLNLLSSAVTKSDCMAMGGYAYWRNDSTMMCIPKGILFVSGKVMTFDEATSSLSLNSEGDTYHILTVNSMAVPKAGEDVEVYYTVDGDGKLRASSVYQQMK
ncbi:MAG: hypothetical protein ABIQ11_03955 [Saprospiraceae bacterium]